MRTLGNILWHFPGFGFLSAIIAFFVGSCLTLTLVASPIGLGLLQYSKFLLAPFSYDMVNSDESGANRNALWALYSRIIWFFYLPFGCMSFLLAVVQIAVLCVIIIGIPMALVVAKSLGVIFNPVGKICVPIVVGEELRRRRDDRVRARYFGEPGGQAPPPEAPRAQDGENTATAGDDASLRSRGESPERDNSVGNDAPSYTDQKRKLFEDYREGKITATQFNEMRAAIENAYPKQGAALPGPDAPRNSARPIIGICCAAAVVILCSAAFFLITGPRGKPQKGMVKVFCTDDNAVLRSKPDFNGRPYDVNSGEYFLVDSPPVLNKKDKSKWYKIIFVSGYEDAFHRTDKLEIYGFSSLYVNAQSVREEPLEEFERQWLDWDRRGRPHANVGEEISLPGTGSSMDYWDSWDPWEVRSCKIPLTLRKEPRDDAEIILLPAGTEMLFEGGTGFSFRHHNNMDEELWEFLVGAKDHKVLGWIKFVELREISEHNMILVHDPFAAPDDASPAGSSLQGIGLVEVLTYLNLRLAPDIDSPVQNQIPSNCFIPVVGTARGTDGDVWYKIESEIYGTGWVSAQFVKLIMDPEFVSDFQTDGEKKSNAVYLKARRTFYRAKGLPDYLETDGIFEFVPSKTTNSRKTVKGENVNIRKEPHSSAPILTKLNTGAPLRAHAYWKNRRGEEWYFVSSPQFGEGWVHGDYVQ
jgi:uncharacterized membrane protein YccF (DUF307 family)